MNEKISVRIRTLNVRIRSEQMAKIMREYKLDILELSECHWKGSGRSKSVNGVEIIFSRMPC